MALFWLVVGSWGFTPDGEGGARQEWLWAAWWGDSAVVVFEDGRAGFGYTDIRVVWVDLLQQQAGGDVSLSDTTRLRVRTDPRVAGDGQVLLAAWTETDSLGSSQILGKRLRGGIGPASEAALLPMGGGVSQTAPVLAYAPGAGVFLVVAEADSAWTHDLWFRLIDAADTGSVRPLDSLHQRSRYAPDAAWIPAVQKFAVVWEAYGATWNSEVHFTWIGLDGSVDTLRWLAGDTALSASSPDVAAGPGDTLAVVYRWSTATGTGIHLLLLDTTGQVMGPPIPVNTDGTGAFRSPPHVETTPTGWMVTWSDDRDGVFRVYLREFTRDGTPVGPEIPVYPPGWASEHAFAFSSAGGPVVVAEVYRPTGEEDLFAAWVLTGDTLDLVQDQGTGDQQNLEAAPGVGGALVSWVDLGKPDSPGVYLRLLERDAPQSSPVGLGQGVRAVLATTPSWVFAALEEDTLGALQVRTIWLDPGTLGRDTSRVIWGVPGLMGLVGVSGDTGVLAVVQGNALFALRFGRSGVDTFLLNDTTGWTFPSDLRFVKCPAGLRLFWRDFTGAEDVVLSRRFGGDGTPDTLTDTVAMFPFGLYALDVACADSGGIWLFTGEPGGLVLYRWMGGRLDTIRNLPGSLHTPVVVSHPVYPRVVALAALEDVGGRDRVVWAVARPDTLWGLFPVDTPAVEVHHGEPHLVADTGGFWVVFTSNEDRRGVDGRAAFVGWPAWIPVEEAAGGKGFLQLAFDPRQKVLWMDTPVPARLRVVNLLGRVIRTGWVRGRTRWRLSTLRPGVYFIRMEGPGQHTTLKILVE